MQHFKSVAFLAFVVIAWWSIDFHSSHAALEDAAIVGNCRYASTSHGTWYTKVANDESFLSHSCNSITYPVAFDQIVDVPTEKRNGNYRCVTMYNESHDSGYILNLEEIMIQQRMFLLFVGDSHIRKFAQLLCERFKKLQTWADDGKTKTGLLYMHFMQKATCPVSCLCGYPVGPTSTTVTLQTSQRRTL